MTMQGLLSCGHAAALALGSNVPKAAVSKRSKQRSFDHRVGGREPFLRPRPRLKPATKPLLTGSFATANRIGSTDLASFAARGAISGRVFLQFVHFEEMRNSIGAETFVVHHRNGSVR